MKLRRPLAVAAAVSIAAAALAGAAVAQTFVPQPQLYLLTTDVFDGRALWVQPAGLARRREASISLMTTVTHDTSGFASGQYGATLASGGLAFGWQHDRLAGGAHADAWVVGYAAGTPQVAVGFDRRWHRGSNTHDGAWDVGARYAPSTLLEMSLVWRDISSPVVEGDTIRATLVPGAALRLLRGRVHLGADWEIVTRGWGTSAVRAGASVVLPARIVMTLRSELDGHFTTRTVSLGLSWNGAATRITGFGTAVHGAADRAGVWGSLVTQAAAPRRRFGR